jgi:hypothetical protein
MSVDQEGRLSVGDKIRDYNSLFGTASLLRRFDILRRGYLDNRFERRSRLPLIPDDVVDTLLSYELVFPPRKFLMRAGGQTVEGLFILGSLVCALRAKEVFEIGTFEGVTTWFLARNAQRESRINTLDIPPEETPVYELEQSDEHRATPSSLVYPALPETPGEIVQHWGDSATFDFRPWEGKCDLIYLDGAHSQEYVTSDTARALSILAPDGIIVWDDYWRMSPGVTSVLNNLRDLELFRVPATRLVVYLRTESIERIVRRNAQK